MQNLTHQGHPTVSGENRRLKRMAIVVLLGLVPLVTGCGGKYESTVTGSVTLDEQPLTLGTVTFHPDNGGPVAYATIGADGSYSLKTGDAESLKPGAYSITVVATEQPPADLPRGALPPIGRLLTPEKYSRPNTTDLKYQVDAGSNEINLALESSP